MALYPYSKIKTEKLGLLLFAGRAVTIIGMLVFVLTIIIGLLVFAMGGPQPIDGGYMMLSTGMRASSLLIVLWGFGVFVVSALAGGIGAGIVVIESHLSRMADKTGNVIETTDDELV